MAKGHISDTKRLDSLACWVQPKTFQTKCKCEWEQMMPAVSIRQGGGGEKI